ncbi:MAG: thioredoxin domain-containing protein [Planctomycetota bacterium]
MSNQLADSLSPYLLQHRDNPVEWYPWGSDAFEAAKQRNVPVFLSVGYAACHWCHVMAHESFENETIAQYLNDHFVSVKVDREERPDIDQIYMNAVQLMTGHGGWPMSVFLDHEGRPFYAGTYWPPVSRGESPGFGQVLDALVDAWTHRREEIHSHADEIHDALKQLAIGTDTTSSKVPTADRVDVAIESLLKTVDFEWGGFGKAPKFPHATDLLLFLRVAARTGDSRLVKATELTLDRMAAGGIRDHIGGGFARYSVDGQWLVPHFEKMLYDNGLLAEVYLRAYQVTGHQRHADVAEQTLEYLITDMVDPAGGLHSSEDADSEGVEGKYYVWKPDEVDRVLGFERAERFCDVYDIRRGGNFEGSSIPNLPVAIDRYASDHNVSAGELHLALAEDRALLQASRQARIRPQRDDKVITAWNAIAIKSLALGGAVLDRIEFLDAAEKAMRFILDAMRDHHGRLRHVFRRGTSHLDAMIDDYALTIEALVTLYEVTANVRWITDALPLADQMRDRFEDDEQGGFFFTPRDGESLITRNKDWHDGSLVSGNGAAAMSLLRLHGLTGHERFESSAVRTLQAGKAVIVKQSRAASALVAALDFFHRRGEQWAIALGDVSKINDVRCDMSQSFAPNRSVAWITQDSKPSPISEDLISGRSANQDQVILFPCESFQCSTPVVNPSRDFWRRRKTQDESLEA